MVMTERVAAILKACPEDVDKAAFINEQVVNSMLPQYSRLRAEGLYLIDAMANGCKNWYTTFPDGTRTPTYAERGVEEDPMFAAWEAVERSVSWLKEHHIKDPSILSYIISHYKLGPWEDGIMLDSLNDWTRENLEYVRGLLKKIDPAYVDYHIGVGQLGRDILEHWDVLWNVDEVYDALHTIAFCENVKKPFEPLEALEILKAVEETYISEIIEQ